MVLRNGPSGADIMAYGSFVDGRWVRGRRYVEHRTSSKDAPCSCPAPFIVLTPAAAIVACASGCTVTNETRASRFPMGVQTGATGVRKGGTFIP